MESVNELLASVVGMPAWMALVVIVLATFVSEDLTCIGAGLVAARGDIGPGFAIAASGLGIFLGDLLLWAAGRYLGQPALRHRPLKWILDEQGVERSEQWFARRGPIVILLGRFVPGSRLPSYFAAGLLNVGFWRFSLFALLAVAIWSPLLVGAAVLLGRGVLRYYEAFSDYALLVFFAALFGLYVVVHWVVPACSWRGRRLLVGRLRRWRRWEFWPPWLFYAPVLLYVLGLALRYRSLSLLTAVNPGIPAGGFVGESKQEILDHLADARGADGERLVAACERLPAELDPDEGLRRVRAFLDEHGLAYPVVLKPDAGQRGSGVAIARGDDAVREYFAGNRVPTQVQEHLSGDEFGLFYVRFPSQPRGRIFSITEKRFPVVVGDGESTLEQLILRDPRAVCLAELYANANAGRLYDVVPQGEPVQLVEIGNHCRGTIFLDGIRHRTEALEEALDRVSQTFPGFYFGRYDVRVSSAADLEAGRGFRILELNGGTSEATHVYDPAFRLVDAYRVLFEQWRLVFAIAAENRARGVRPVPWTRLLGRLEAYRGQARSHPT